MAVAAAAALLTAGTANAVTYTLDHTDVAGFSALSAPYGKVDVIEFGANTLQYTVTLFDGLRFVDTGSHNAFTFALVGAPVVTYSGPAGIGFVRSVNNVKNAPFDGFDYGLTCSTMCPTAGGVGYASPLVFSVSAMGLTLASIDAATVTHDGLRILFAADTMAIGGATGTIGGGTLVTPPPPPVGVPEPASWLMMIVGFGGVGSLLRRRRLAGAL